MDQRLTLIGAACAGAGFMYLIDPISRRRRLAQIRDKAIHLSNVGTNAVDALSADFPHRMQGLLVSLNSAAEPTPVDNDILVERARSKIGRLVRHPGSIEVAADQGQLTLRGPILADEVQHLINGLAGVRGVRGIVNQLEMHRSPDGVSGLQGQPVHVPEFLGILPQNWDPTTRFVAAGLGAGLAAMGFSRRDLIGTILGVTGLGTVTRAATNMPLDRLFGIGGGRRAIDVQKTINIAAPVNNVFAIWANPERFPMVMEHVETVRAIGPNRTEWTVRGPAGLAIRWTAVTTRVIPDQEIAWESTPGAIISNAGIARFRENPTGGTRVDIKLSYTPPLGAVGHVVALILGVDPKHDLDEDLVRFKSLVECGKTTVHHQQVDLDQLVAHGSARSDELDLPGRGVGGEA
jgi:uncharacterized membrane protein